MHAQFPQWYRLVTVDPRGDILSARWAAIQNVVDAADVDSVLGLTRAALSRLSKRDEFRTKLEQGIQNADSTYAMGANEAELSVVAVGAIAQLLEGKELSDLATLASLCVVSAYSHGLFGEPPIPEVVTLAKEFRRKRSAAIRSELSWPNVRDPAIQLEPAPLQTAASNPAVHISQLRTAFGQVSDNLSQFRGSLRRIVEPLLEATEITWWLLGEYSRDLDCRMRDVPAGAAPVILGKELADLTRVQPGPVAAGAFMHRMLQSVKRLPKTVRIDQTVNATPRAWRERWTEEVPENPDDMTPVLLAVHVSLETDEEADWLPPYRKRSGLDATAAMNPLELASQVYDESLSLKLRAALRDSTNGDEE